MASNATSPAIAITPEKKAPPSSIPLGYQMKFGPELVDLFVGPDKTQFKVHKEILCERIPYFQKIFQGGFKEAEEFSATFTEDTLEAFELLIEWTYSGRVHAISPDFPKEEAVIKINIRLNLYVLADKMCLPTLGDYAITTIISNLLSRNLAPRLNMYRMAYSLTSSGSPLRAFISSMVHFVMRAGLQDLDKTAKYALEAMKVNGDLGEDVIRVLRNHDLVNGGSRTPVDPRKIPKCRFHSHVPDAPCNYKEDIL